MNNVKKFSKENMAGSIKNKVKVIIGITLKLNIQYKSYIFLIR